MVALTGDAEDTMNGAEVRVWMLLLHQSIGDIFYVAIARICKENWRQRVNCIKTWGNFNLGILIIQITLFVVTAEIAKVSSHTQ